MSFVRTGYELSGDDFVCDPDSSNWKGSELVKHVLRMMDQAYQADHAGPFVLEFSRGWDQYLDMDYIPGPCRYPLTVRDRLSQIAAIADITSKPVSVKGLSMMMYEVRS